MTAFFDETIRMGYCADMVCRYSDAFKGMEFDEAAASMGEDATAIYMMWGTNYTPDATAQSYIDIVDFLLEACPNATIHLQLIPYGQNIAYTAVNERIRGAYDYYQEIGEERVFLIDTYTAIGTSPIDGVHQGNYGNGNWYQAIVDHAQANGLSE